MILYTPLNDIQIFNSNFKPELSYKSVNNVFVECIKNNNKLSINRIISTNPNDYINPRISLGKEI